MKKLILKCALITLCSITGLGQDTHKPRLFVEDSRAASVSARSGGEQPPTAEIMRVFAERCPDCIITNNKERADYTVRVEHDGGLGLALKHNKFALFNREGDMINTGSTRTLANAVKDACEALRRDWQPQPPKPPRSHHRHTE